MATRTDERQGRIRGRREKRKLARQARVRRQVLRYFLLCVLFATGASAFIYLPWQIVDLERDIHVAGNLVVSDEQVRGALSNCLDKPLWRLNPAVLASQVQSLEAVKYAFVRRYLFPHPRLVVDVLEEFPWASFSPAPDAPNQDVIAESGRLIPINEFPGIVQPKLRIFGTDSTRFAAKEVNEWASWSAYIASQTGQSVDFIDLRNPTDIRVSDGDLYLKLGSADSSLTRRLGRLASLMPAIGQVRDKLVYIDLGLDNNIPLNVSNSKEHLRNLRLQETQSLKSTNAPETTPATMPGANVQPVGQAPLPGKVEVKTVN